MTKKIVQKHFSVAGTEPFSMFKQYLLYRRMPYLNIGEGPRLKYLFELYLMHNLASLMVDLEIRHPARHRFLIRIRNSLVFRYNHYRGVLARKLNR